MREGHVFAFGLFSVLITIAINVAVIYGVACVGGSAFKAATDKCAVTWKVDKFIATDLFCEE